MPNQVTGLGLVRSVSGKEGPTGTSEGTAKQHTIVSQIPVKLRYKQGQEHIVQKCEDS